MINSAIYDGDILVVDPSIEPEINKIVIGIVNRDFTEKRLIKKNKKIS